MCPTCGNRELPADDNEEMIVCGSCNREFTKDELIHENSEVIEAEIEEITEEILDDFNKTFKNLFKN
jgi:DNA-directed RNA polymerase subunit M/transcription elongation factor TFIIS